MTPIVQIYEVQTPEEARLMIELGVAHIGSVVMMPPDQHPDPVLRESIALTQKLGAISSLIPLYSDKDAVLKTLAYYQPDIIHFCEHLSLRPEQGAATASAWMLQADVRHAFPAIKMMRSIPIGQAATDSDEIIALAKRFASVSDFFLTDTVLTDDGAKQPENGFVGITGKTCDWTVAARLVAESGLPVILAGGISPENVADGIRQVRPFGVDSCTCTNAVGADGRPVRFKKDPERVRALVEAVQSAAGTR